MVQRLDWRVDIDLPDALQKLAGLITAGNCDRSAKPTPVATARVKGRLLLRLLRRAGSECMEEPARSLPYRLRLIHSGDRAIRWSLSDASGALVREGSVTPAGGPWRRSAAVVRSVLEEVYSVR